MKNICLLLLFSVSPLLAQVKYGPRIGANLASVSSDALNTKINLRPSFQIGAITDIRLSETLFFQGSLLFSERGYGFLAVSESVDSSLASPRSAVVTSEGKRVFAYLDVPVMLVYKMDLGIGRAFFGAGPYFSYNLRGINRENNTYVVNSDRDLSITKISGNYDMNRLNEISRTDYGTSLTAGLEFNEKWQLAAQYSLGLADIDPGEPIVRNRTTSITLVCLFGH